MASRRPNNNWRGGQSQSENGRGNYRGNNRGGYRGSNRGSSRGNYRGGNGQRQYQNRFDDSDNSWGCNTRPNAWSKHVQPEEDLSNTMSSLNIQEPIVAITGQEAIDALAKEREERAKEWAKIDFDKADRQSAEFLKQKWAKYPVIVKHIYEEHPDVKNWAPSEVAEYRKNANNIYVQVPEGVKADHVMPRIPNPIPKFEYAFINYPEIQKLLLNAGFDTPSPIQSQAWPLIMEGCDTIGIAQTGSGKTLAFLLPAYVHILNQAKVPGLSPGANVLVMAPTRELAQQIHQEVGKFDYAGLRSVCIYGGVDRKKQIADVQKGCNIIIATPGRLDDLIMAKVIDITTVTFVVLDEADRMLDCGFEPQIRKTMYKIRPNRQTIMTSATWPSGVQRLANSYMKNPIQVVIGSLDLAAVNSVTQKFEFVADDADVKLDFLLEFVEQNDANPDLRVMVFCTSKATASFVASELQIRDLACTSIRGDMEQEEREYSIEAIKSGHTKYLVATDVASRGIDISDLTHVINFDFPRDIEEYVHRVGRTGRAGKTGTAITFFTRRDSKHAVELIKILEKAKQDIPYDLQKYAENHSKRMKRFEAEGRPQRNRSRYAYDQHF